MFTPVLTPEDRCPNPVRQINHCWHVLGSSTDGLGKRGWDDRRCCFCGEERRQHWEWVLDPDHGPHFQVEILRVRE